ncbi:NnrU family protein [Luminiphilus syltensis NOR5-1B]|uniref:NnrU family protein n=2 Tax=Luminiphilus TaxID=1341118 RepID=B8KXF9_9GAMM|nr:NnrU family protein [Luminiphilus syltensis NOR5-1B]
MGSAGRAVMAVLILASIYLMAVGYQPAMGTFFWGRNPMLVGINNLLVLLAVYLMVASTVKPAIVAKIRHPQLTAVKAWAVGHLLVNGDAASFILFGGLLAWAVASVIIINKQDGKPELVSTSGAGKEVMTVVITLVVFGGIAWVHNYLGYPVFG